MWAEGRLGTHWTLANGVVVKASFSSIDIIGTDDPAITTAWVDPKVHHSRRTHHHIFLSSPNFACTFTVPQLTRSCRWWICAAWAPSRAAWPRCTPTP